jgi:hypothetical protein
MLTLQPGMVSKICESFNVLYLMVAGPFHDARIEDQPLMPTGDSDIRPKKSVSAHGESFDQVSAWKLYCAHNLRGIRRIMAALSSQR